MFGLQTLLSKRLRGDERRRLLLARFADTVFAHEPLSVVDAGALFGLQPELEPIAHRVDAVAFEPDANECARLNERAQREGLRQRFIPVAIGGADEQRVLNVTRQPASSSLLEPNAQYFARFPNSERMDVVERVPVEVRDLDGVLAELGVAPEYLKLDVHGVESEVLRGLSAERCHRLLGVHVEIAVAPHWVGQSSLGEIDSLIRERGLELYSIRRYSSRRAGFDATRLASRGQLSFIEALYLRDDRTLDPSAHPRLAVLAATFGHLDYALHLLEDNPAAAAIATDLARRLHGVRGTLSRFGADAEAGFGPLAGSWSSDQPPDWL
jgi:FkbM family methyltransferase